ncbi:MAG TPA: OsmC family protein [Bacteroidales bacterium]|nr:OsmC family protein [Bacteroidales bacterium]
MDSVDIIWDGKMSFTSEVDGHKITIDAKPDFGGEDRGPRPKPLILTALGGCTAMDVISMLKKMRVNVKNFEVKVDGALTDEHPKHYFEITVSYNITGEDINIENVKKAVSLSEERYCGVSYILKKALKINSKIIINGVEI